jgi:hypothetical protein
MAAIAAVANAVTATERIVFHSGLRGSLLAARAYPGFDARVAWTAFRAIHAHAVPGFAIEPMAYVIAALGRSIRYLPGSER